MAGSSVQPLNLLTDAWIPWLKQDGSVVTGPVAWLVLEAQGNNPVVDVATDRPDERLALLEFFVGVISTALALHDEADWHAAWVSPPAIADLQRALDVLKDAFELDGDGPRFLQDIDPGAFESTEVLPAEKLWIDEPGGNGVSNNTDLFVHRRHRGPISRRQAALALLTFQTYAPAGGQGHRTSVRGGGPIVTLVDPRPRSTDAAPARAPSGQSLWYKILANVWTQSQISDAGAASDPPGIAQVFPWCAATRTSDPKRAGGPTQPEDAHPLQALFGMPRRIRLEVRAEPVDCPVLGKEDPVRVVGFRMLNYGVQYLNWMHPLTPHYRTKDQGWLPLHGQPAGILWRDWPDLGLLGQSDSPDRRAAEAVRHFAAYRAHRAGVMSSHLRIHVAGGDFDNMKLRGWIDTEMPAFVIRGPWSIEVRRVSHAAADAASICARALHDNCKKAQFATPDEAPPLDWVNRRFWEATEPDFIEMIGGLSARSPDEAGQALDKRTALDEVHAFLRRRTLALFDELCPFEDATPPTYARVLDARRLLTGILAGYTKAGEALYKALSMPLPEPTKKSGPKAKSASARAAATAPRKRKAPLRETRG